MSLDLWSAFLNHIHWTPVLLIAVLAILSIEVTIHFFEAAQKRRRLHEEMKALGFSDYEEKVMTQLVNKKGMIEPREALVSLPMFDQLARSETQRVLASGLPDGVKAQTIRMMIDIRKKAFFGGREFTDRFRGF
ncbi:MAG: hypothetical protein GC154_16025 [bacterium]|nr:hypothetical protein [bacterium]